MARWYVSFKGLKPLDFAVLIFLIVAVGSYVWKDYVKEMKEKSAKTSPTELNQSESDKK